MERGQSEGEIMKYLQIEVQMDILLILLIYFCRMWVRGKAQA